MIPVQHWLPQVGEWGASHILPPGRFHPGGVVLCLGRRVGRVFHILCRIMLPCHPDLVGLVFMQALQLALIRVFSSLRWVLLRSYWFQGSCRISWKVVCSLLLGGLVFSSCSLFRSLLFCFPKGWLVGLGRTPQTDLDELLKPLIHPGQRV